MEQNNKVRHFKLINGEQIIAAVNSKNKDNWYLEMPVQITSGLLSSYQFSPWFPFSDEENFKIAFGNVVIICSYFINEFNIFLNKALRCSLVLFNFL